MPKKTDGLSFEAKQKSRDEYPEDFLDAENEHESDLKEITSFEVNEEIEVYDDSEDDLTDIDPDDDESDVGDEPEYEYADELGESDPDEDLDEDYNLEDESENNNTSNTSVQW